MREVKKLLRAELIAERKSMDIAAKNAADLDILEQIKPLADRSSMVLTYASTPIEVDTRRLIGYCLEKRIPVALPKSGNTELSFYFINSMSDLTAGRFGIDEPPEDRPAVFDEKALCIVPALCADGSGSRLGYGRGYYDRFLSNFNGTSVIICYSGFKRVVPTEPHDFKANLTIFDRTTICPF